MHKLSFVLILALLSHVVLGSRLKRQLSGSLERCLTSCPVTPEYNPVCGSNNVTYDNPGRLLCARECGVNVTQVKTGRCPNTTVPPVA